ncbi:MAG: hypothetical protein L6R40_005996 [Gallowayella cf. fulva]|nr:MAG: hypothetical protein L6R40_005996 [Xanthomendoza cf. fulva]
MDGLLHKGASLEFEQWLDSPLALAIRNGHLGIAQALLKRGVDVREVDLTTHRTFTHLLAWHACRNRGMEDTKASELLEILVRYGASLDAIDIQGNTALHLAATGSSNGTTVPCQLAIIQDLVQKGARVDLLSSTFTAAIVGLLFITCNAFQREIADFFSNHHVPPGLVPANKTGFYDPLAPYVAPALSTIVSKAVSAASEGHSLFSDYVSDVSEDISVDMSMLIHPRATPFNPLPPPDDTSSLPTTTTTPSSLLPLPTSTESDAAPPTADPSDVIPHSPGKDEYRLYTGNGSIAAGWPHKADWMSYEAMFTTNIPLILHSCKIWHVAPNTLPEIHSIHTATLTISHATNTDARFILAIILQESNGCVRVPTSFYSLRNPGLMQSHNGPATCNEDASPVYPCPYETIEEMIREGTAGTFEGRGMGLVMAGGWMM